MKKIMSNYLFILLYQLLIMITPLVTMPYVVRMLSSNSIGVEAYVSSIVQIFTTVASLGMGDYGRKVIASVSDSEEIETVFWHLYIVQFLCSGIIFGVYLLFVAQVSQYQQLFWINSLTVLANVLDITWLYTGQENIKKIMVRNMVVRFLSVVGIFCLVRGRQDLAIYVGINAITLLLGQLVTWVPLLRKKYRVNVDLESCKQYIIPSLSFSLVPLVSLIPNSLNKVILGSQAGPTEVGYYNQAYKLITIFLVLITAFSTVMSPKIIKSYQNKDQQQFSKDVAFSFQYMMISTLPILGGLIIIAPTFIPLLLGKNFIPAIVNLQILAPSLLFSALASILGIQVLVSTGKNGQYILSIIIGAATSGFANFFFAKEWASNGTCIAYLIFTLVTCTVQLVFSWQFIDLKTIFLSCRKAIIAFLVMIFGDYFLSKYLVIASDLKQLGVLVIFGAIFYLGTLFLLRESLLMDIFGLVIGKIIGGGGNEKNKFRKY